MRTVVLKPDKNGIDKAAKIIVDGGIVAFPTETVYGLGANAFDEKAILKVFKAKGRPQDNPLIVHISSFSQLDEISNKVSPDALLLAKKFWPGPLTIVVKKSKKISKKVTAGLDTVAVRMPSDKVAFNLIKLAGVPIAAPSANISGKPSPTKAKHVIDDLSGKVDAIIDGKDCMHGLESTVVDTTTEPMVLLRPGKVTFEQLEKFLGKGRIVKYELKKGGIKEVKSPGMKYTHYSPNAKVILLVGKKKKVLEKMVLISKTAKQKTGIISLQKVKTKNEFVVALCLCSEKRFAKDMFHLFREMDSLGVKEIYVEGMGKNGLGLAIMNRLEKASKRLILCN